MCVFRSIPGWIRVRGRSTHVGVTFGLRHWLGRRAWECILTGYISAAEIVSSGFGGLDAVITRPLPGTVVDENGQVAFVLYTDELAPITRVQQRGRPVRLSPGQFVEVDHDRGRTQNTKPVVALRCATEHLGEVFVAGHKQVQHGRDRLSDVSQIEPILLSVRIPGSTVCATASNAA